MTYGLKHIGSGVYVAPDSQGEHDNRVTYIESFAKTFNTWGEASDFAQNFSVKFEIVELDIVEVQV